MLISVQHEIFAIGSKALKLSGLYVAACCLTRKNTRLPFLGLNATEKEVVLVVVLEIFIVVLYRFISCAHGDTCNLFKRLNFFASWYPTRHVQIRHTTQGKT